MTDHDLAAAAAVALADRMDRLEDVINRQADIIDEQSRYITWMFARLCGTSRFH